MKRLRIRSLKLIVPSLAHYDLPSMGYTAMTVGFAIKKKWRDFPDAPAPPPPPALKEHWVARWVFVFS